MILKLNRTLVQSHVRLVLVQAPAAGSNGFELQVCLGDLTDSLVTLNHYYEARLLWDYPWFFASNCFSFPPVSMTLFSKLLS